MALNSTPPKSSVAIALAVVIGAVLYTVAVALGKRYDLAFFSIPLFVGLPIGLLQPERPYRASLIALGLGLLLTLVTAAEGVICMLFALPVLAPPVLLGAFTGSVLRRYVRSRRAQRASVGVMLFIGVGAQFWGAATDDVRNHPLHSAETAVEIAAPASQVFAAITARELRVARRWPWFIRIGLPMPEAMIIEQPGLRGRMRFDFAYMTAFGTITAWNPPYEFRYTIDRYAVADPPFHITRLGRDPDYGLRREHMSDWLSVLDTRYRVEPLPQGRTRLLRRIVWQRHLSPSLYFGWLQQTVIERGQTRLLELIRERIQQSPGSARSDTAPES